MMSQRPTVLVTAPSRLHFGLLSFGNPDVRQFGGVGVMIDRPGLKLRVEAAETFETAGQMQDRLRDAAFHWLDSSSEMKELRCKVELATAPRLHAGLGAGTQLALAVATGLNAFHNRATPAVEDLAASVGRGLRSAVGTYGFFAGGLIAERGKLPTETVSPLLERVALPNAWRFVLVSPSDCVGLHGTTEQTAFDQLPPVPSDVTGRLTHLLCDRILPAAKSARFADFSDAVYDFGFLAGGCFASVQGSEYNGPRLANLVKHIRAIGVRGVGQSSWGPTIYAICESESHALAFANDLHLRIGNDNYELIIASPDNDGARVSTASGDL
jgi:beta-RFAP synthase